MIIFEKKRNKNAILRKHQRRLLAETQRKSQGMFLVEATGRAKRIDKEWRTFEGSIGIELSSTKSWIADGKGTGSERL